VPPAPSVHRRGPADQLASAAGGPFLGGCPARGPPPGRLPPAPLAKALVEYGKLLQTLYALRWFTDEAFRRRISRQLNRGEARSVSTWPSCSSASPGRSAASKPC
jgi:hypothetical protein